MATLTLQVENSTILDSLKKILGLMRGVRIVDIDENPYNSDVPNETTLSAMHEAESGDDGGLVDMTSLDHFVASME